MRALLGLIVIGVVALGARAAHAQHCHVELPEAPTDDTPAARAWWATVSTVWAASAGRVRDEQSDFMPDTRAYQGASVVVAAGWRRLAGRVALGAWHVDGAGVGLDDLRGALSVTLTPARRWIAAGVSGAFAVPTGDADAGRGMGHEMASGGAWVRATRGEAQVSAQVTYARALGDGAEHAAHLHGSELWPLVDPMNPSELAVQLGGALAVAPAVTVRADVVYARATGRGPSRAVPSAGVRIDRRAAFAGAGVAYPVLGEPFTVRGELELGYRF